VNQAGFEFAGFFGPVSNLPYINEARVGKGVHMSFSLNGDHGLGVVAPGYPRSHPIDCRTLLAVGPSEMTRAAGMGYLTYHPAADRYTYIWQTEQAWLGTCRAFVLRLTDGSEHVAHFRFR
jgi:hypothetical protein